ncbi:hypothetical protein EVAR_66469_1 [Eumeta japonica]|uniref:Nucleic-acid-binding protein from transposon X-element n=1 Tax=Eumeta variegata TaxID=151549 RepID=A0A4C1SGL1_EUMVA|nr:hypothetical protein EVAR_66469_1 [Eumeta japonica]
MAAEIKRTQDAIDRMDIPNKLEAPQDTGDQADPCGGCGKAETASGREAASSWPKDRRCPHPYRLVPMRQPHQRSSSHACPMTLSSASRRALKLNLKISASKPEPSLPLIIIRDVLKVNSDAQIVESLKRQNGHTTEGLIGEVEARVRYRRRARNPRVPSGPRGVARAIYASHKTGYVCGVAAATGLGPVALVQCSRCLGFGHSKKWCREQNDKCAHCGGDHTGPTCPDRKAAQPQTEQARYGGAAGWSEQAQDCSGTSPGALRGQYWRAKRYPAVGSSNGGPACRTRKAAILILDSDVDVEEDQTLIDENVTAAVVTAGNCRIGVVSVYFECDKPIGPYLDRVKWVCSKLGTNKIILGRRQRMERVVGSERDDARGTELCDFLDVEGLHVLNEGNIPTFEVYRGPSREVRWT